MNELERALVALGHELDIPPAPDLMPRVRPRLEPRRRRFGRPLAVAIALIVVAFGIAMAVPDARSAILRFFHIGSITVERVDTLPVARERSLAAGLGPPLPRAEAERLAGLAMEWRRLKGPKPTRYYARPGVIAALFEAHGKPVLLTELGSDQLGLTKKFASPETRVEPVQIGRFGILVSGGKHVLMWQGGTGQVHEVETRLAGNVLIWLSGLRTYRLEGELSKAQLLELGRQITR
jgi:hypothetical protein